VEDPKQLTYAASIVDQRIKSLIESQEFTRFVALPCVSNPEFVQAAKR
jgi:hypothetical protein